MHVTCYLLLYAIHAFAASFALHSGALHDAACAALAALVYAALAIVEQHKAG